MNTFVSEIEIAWLAGLLEGEGNFGFNWNAIRSGKSPRIRISMTDEDILQRVADLIGRITGNYPRVRGRSVLTGNKQPAYEVCTYGANANTIMRLIVGYMGQRRRKKIWQT